LKWLGLSRFGRGLTIALCGFFIKAFSHFVESDHLSLFITSVGVIVFVAGLYIALFGMHNHYKEFEEVRLRTKEKE
jgi:FtsH-binding integral membrane protein